MSHYWNVVTRSVCERARERRWRIAWGCGCAIRECVCHSKSLLEQGCDGHAASDIRVFTRLRISDILHHPIVYREAHPPNTHAQHLALCFSLPSAIRLPQHAYKRVLNSPSSPLQHIFMRHHILFLALIIWHREARTIFS